MCRVRECVMSTRLFGFRGCVTRMQRVCVQWVMRYCSRAFSAMRNVGQSNGASRVRRDRNAHFVYIIFSRGGVLLVGSELGDTKFRYNTCNFREAIYGLYGEPRADITPYFLHIFQVTEWNF